MKKLLFLLVFIPLVFACSEDKKNSQKELIHPLDKEYDSTSIIFNDPSYSKKELIKIVKRSGPLTFRKENGVWYYYNYGPPLSIGKIKMLERSLEGTSNTAVNYRRIEKKYWNAIAGRLSLYRIPVDSVYGEKKLTSIDVFNIDYKSGFDNTYSSGTVQTGTGKKSFFGELAINEYILTHTLGVVNPSYEEIFSSGGEVSDIIIYNTTKNNYKNLKITISSNPMLDYVNNVSTIKDTFLIDEHFMAGELKIVPIIPTYDVEIERGININIIDYDIF